MFIGFIGLGSYFWTTNRGVSLALFILTFVSVLGQVACLALYLRTRAYQTLTKNSPPK